MSSGPKPNYGTCRHFSSATSATVMLASGRVRHRLYGNCTPAIATHKEKDCSSAVVRFPTPIFEKDWLVCLASYKVKRSIRTWPEWTWGTARSNIPVWFRGENFMGETSSEKGSFLITSCDVELYMDRLHQDRPEKIHIANHHWEKNSVGRRVYYMTFSWNGSIMDLKPSGWAVPLKAAAKRLGIPVKEL